METILKIEIPEKCASKKNSQRIINNPRTHKPMVIQSEAYKNFEKSCYKYFIDHQLNIDYPINLKCTFVFPDKRRRDIVNYLNAIQDILTYYHVIQDDNYDIIQSLDGTRCIYEKGVEKTIVEIIKL